MRGASNTSFTSTILEGASIIGRGLIHSEAIEDLTIVFDLSSTPEGYDRNLD